jgi:hypothetical protein
MKSGSANAEIEEHAKAGAIRRKKGTPERKQIFSCRR